MTSARGIDLVSELEKAKANVSMLESILAIEKQKDEQQLSLSKSQAEVKSLTTNLQAAKTELDILKASLTKDEEEHRTKAEEWRAKNSEIQRIVFNADMASNNSSDNEDDLEGAVQLAEENAALLRQKLALRQFSSKIKCKGQEITSLESSLSKKGELHLIVENQLKRSTDDFYKAEKNINRNCRQSTFKFSKPTREVVIQLWTSLPHLL
jgi:chromosome segregation ATPase